jgi:aspartyl-tRNA(Asn)/glutamyl-tRNA(Gln) amidotransferase subunit A
VTDSLPSASTLAQDVREGRRCAEDLAREALSRARNAQHELNAFIELLDDEALAIARTVDSRARAGEALPLAGVPVAIKNNICLGPDAGLSARTTCASRMLEHYRSPFTATAVRRLIDAGAVPIATTNMDEFAMGSSTERSFFGPTRNPRDRSRVAGGSSGGSAAAVASGVVPLALGSDTGGSIRQPAALTGIVGVKPTYGRVSRSGLVAYASSLDQIGPLATTVRDCALALEALCGPDPLDATSADRPDTDFLRDIEVPIAGLRLAIPRQARSGANHPDVARAFDQALARFRDVGADIVDVDMPSLDAAIAAYYIVAPAEASSNLARFDGVRYGHRADLPAGATLRDMYCRTRSEGFGEEVQRRIMLGTHVLSSGYYDAYYATALKARRLLLHDFTRVFDGGCHAVLTPTAPNPAWPLGDKTQDPLAMYLEDVYTVAVNLAGLPAMSVPMGASAGLPLGLQVITAPFEDALMLRVGRMFERTGELAPAR